MEKLMAAICEDEPKVLEYLHRQLSFHLQAEHQIINFDCYQDGQALIDAVRKGKNYQLLFLDIDMPEINGIEVCRRIRRIHNFPDTTLVIFISNKEELVFQTFEVQPFRFIRKSHFHEELPSLAAAICRELNRKKGVTLTIEEQHSNMVYSVNINDILYVEVIGKYCHIITPAKELKIRYQLSALSDMLAGYGFLQPHRSYLVNCRYIFSIEKNEILLDDQTAIPVSRNRVRQVKQEFLEFTRGF